MAFYVPFVAVRLASPNRKTVEKVQGIVNRCFTTKRAPSRAIVARGATKIERWMRGKFAGNFEEFFFSSGEREIKFDYSISK